MQDIGGCRAIVKDLNQLHEIHKKLIKSKSVHKIIHTSNYLTPKKSGYGGVHLIYSCFYNSDNTNPWRKTKIEVQLRTKLQHAWATSLEIIDTLEGINLKTRMEGHEEWRRFFAISGQLVAHDDGAIIIADEKLQLYRKELVQLETNLNAVRKIMEFSFGIKALTSPETRHIIRKQNISMCLVTISKQSFNNTKDNNNSTLEINVQIKAFSTRNTKQALKELNESELDDDILISVLLSTSDAKNLKRAYPNYFGSSTEFTTFITKQCSS